MTYSLRLASTSTINMHMFAINPMIPSIRVQANLICHLISTKNLFTSIDIDSHNWTQIVVGEWKWTEMTISDVCAIFLCCWCKSTYCHLGISAFHWNNWFLFLLKGINSCLHIYLAKAVCTKSINQAIQSILCFSICFKIFIIQISYECIKWKRYETTELYAYSRLNMNHIIVNELSP